MPEMQAMKPCARCEQELPESFFDHADAMFCKRCNREIQEVMRKKYNIIEAAYFRAQLRHSSKKLKKRLDRPGTTGRSVAAAGD